MTEPLRDVLAAVLHPIEDVNYLCAGGASGHTDVADRIIAALAQQGVSLTREPGLDVERLARAIAKACPWHLRNENVPCAPNVARE